MCVFPTCILHTAKLHCARVHCKDSVNVHGLLAYWSLSIKNAAKNFRKDNDEITGATSGWASWTEGQRRGTSFHWLLTLCQALSWALCTFKLNFSFKSSKSTIKKWRAPQPHRPSFCTTVAVTIKYSIRWHSWEWPKLCLCLLSPEIVLVLLGISTVGKKAADELLLCAWGWGWGRRGSLGQPCCPCHAQRKWEPGATFSSWQQESGSVFWLG